MKLGYSFDGLAKYVEDIDKTTVKLTGAQTIAGVKTFSDTPLSNTALTLGDSSKKLANTEFVDASMGSFKDWLALDTNGQLPVSVIGKVVHTPLNGKSITLPLGAGVPFGSTITIQNTSQSTTTVAAGGTEKLWLGGSVTPLVTLKANDTLIVVAFNNTSGALQGWMAIGGSVYLAATESFSSLKAFSGWQRLPGGLILQWTGLGSFAGGTQPSNFVWPIPFPNACVQVAASKGVASPDYDSNPQYRADRQDISIGVPSILGVEGQFFADTAPQNNRRVSVIAIGY